MTAQPNRDLAAPALPVSIGTEVVFAKTVGESDVYGFAGITGDFFENHVDEEAMRATPFGGRIAHGALLVGFMSTTSTMLIGESRKVHPGWTVVALGYDRIRFVAPVRLGDTVTVRYRIAALDPARGRTSAEITVTNQRDETVAVATGLLKWMAKTPDAPVPSQPSDPQTSNPQMSAPQMSAPTAEEGFSALLATLLPGDDDFPDAARTGTPTLVMRRLAEADPGRPARLLALLDAAGPPFARRDAAERIAAVRRLEAAEPDLFRALLTVAYVSYYEAPEVIEAIRRTGLPYNDTPQPLGYALPAFQPADAPGHGVGSYVPTDAVRPVPLPDYE